VTIADEVRALRTALDETTARFAKRWHRSGRTIEDWEQGRSEPDGFVLDAMRKLAARTLPANRVRVGQVIRVTVKGRYTTAKKQAKG
jgi:transcriptional regulator with XRE-family HTH domain